MFIFILYIFTFIKKFNYCISNIINKYLSIAIDMQELFSSFMKNIESERAMYWEKVVLKMWTILADENEALCLYQSIPKNDLKKYVKNMTEVIANNNLI